MKKFQILPSLILMSIFNLISCSDDDVVTNPLHSNATDDYELMISFGPQKFTNRLELDVDFSTSPYVTSPDEVYSLLPFFQNSTSDWISIPYSDIEKKVNISVEIGAGTNLNTEYAIDIFNSVDSAPNDIPYEMKDIKIIAVPISDIIKMADNGNDPRKYNELLSYLHDKN